MNRDWILSFDVIRNCIEYCIPTFITDDSSVQHLQPDGFHSISILIENKRKPREHSCLHMLKFNTVKCEKLVKLGS